MAVVGCSLAPCSGDRLIGAVWLAAGGLAALLQQWWWLKGYQQLGAASLFISIGLVGLATTALSPAGFVAAAGSRHAVILVSLALFVGVLVALAAAVHFRGNVKFAAVIPVIALSVQSALRRTVPRDA